LWKGFGLIMLRIILRGGRRPLDKSISILILDVVKTLSGMHGSA
jgi:hypothetical protein